MNADDLRAVAADIRKKASTSEASADPWYDAQTLAEIDLLCAEDAEHIAAWRPSVALVVADWLSVEAAICDVSGYTPRPVAEALVKAWRGGP
jgi:hypothetical protein